MAMRKLKLIFNTLIYKQICNFSGHFRFVGQKVYFPKNSHTFLAAVARGVYEEQNIQFLRTWLKPGTCYIDIGSNIGLMAVPFLESEVKSIVSIEASPFTYSYLRRTHAENIYCDKWIVMNCAVGGQSGVLPFYTSQATGGTYDSFKDTGRVVFDNIVEVPVKTLDQVWNELGAPNVSIVKVDIEGADLLALEGGLNMISECNPAILMEWIPKNLAPYSLGYQRLTNLLQTIHYDCFILPSATRMESQIQLDLASGFNDTIVLLPKKKGVLL